MLPRRHRIPGKQLLSVLRGRVLAREDHLTIKTAENWTERGRAAVIISAKLIKTAVGRNHLKRQLMAILTSKQLIPGWDIAVIVK